MMTNPIAFYQFCSALRRKGALALCLALCTLGLGVSAGAQVHRPSITTFDPPDTVYTSPMEITPTETIVGFYIDTSNVWHGFLRAPSGAITTVDAPGLGTSSNQGDAVWSINPAGATVGNYTDASWVMHGFLRAPDGRFTTFDAPGAGTGEYQGTVAASINPAGAITGYYVDKNSVSHGFLRSPQGRFTRYDAPGAGSSSGQGTAPNCCSGLDPGGTIVGGYIDGNNVNHGFLRAPDGRFTTFEAPGADTTPGSYHGTSPSSHNPAGAITGTYGDASNVSHGFLRAPDGRFTRLDAPGAGGGAGQGTWGSSINPAGAITGGYVDGNSVIHAFLRDLDGRFTTFDARGAGSGAGQGTWGNSINPSGAITGNYSDANGVYHGFLRTPGGDLFSR